MFKKFAGSLLILFLLLPALSKSVAEEKRITIVYQGKIYEVNGMISKGVTTVSYEDMDNIINCNLNNYQFLQTKQDKHDQISVRKFAEQHALKVVWEENTQTIVMGKNANICAITDSDAILSRFLSHDWLTVDSELEMQNYFGEFLLPELAREVAEKAWSFVKEPTDWHWTYELGDLWLIDQGSNFKVILAIILENQGEVFRKGYGLFTLEQQTSGEWLISGMRLKWP